MSATNNNPPTNRTGRFIGANPHPTWGRADQSAVGTVNRPLRMTLVCLYLCLFFIPFSTVHAASIATTGHITGQLLNGTRKNAQMAGQSVTLQMAQGNTSRDLTTVTTDAHGAYAFTHLATDSSISYALYIKYQGAQYTSDVVTLNSKPVRTVNLTVYEATNSTADIAIVQSTVLLHEPDTQKGVLSVSELLIFRNVSARTYVGSLDTSHGKPNALLFTLPHTAHNVSLGKGFDGYTAVQVNGGFASDAAVPPGDAQFAFTFDMPYTTSSYDFDYTVQYPTVQLTMLIPPDIHGSSSTLTAQGPVTADQQPLDLFQATTLTANQVIHLQLDGLPAPTLPSPGSSSNQSMIWLVTGIVAMVAILLGTWLFYRSKRRTVANTKKRRKRTRQGQQKTQPGTPSTSQKAIQGKKVTTTKTERLEETEAVNGAEERKGQKGQKAGNVSDREQVLLLELLELDKAYEAGKLTKAVYQERRARTKAQLRSVMSEKVIS